MPIFRGKNIVSAVSDYKDSVRLATRSNVDLTTQVYSVDGIPLTHKSRVLLAGQSDATQNGIYWWNSVTSRLRRSDDADTGLELNAGAKIYVEEGDHNSKTNFVLTTPGDITIGQTELTFTRQNRIGNFDYSGTYGTTTKTVSITLNESGEIASISEHDISVDGGEF
jgi:hypothetical protein